MRVLEVSVGALLSESQNRLFRDHLDRACRVIGLDQTTTDRAEQADIAYLCGLPASGLLDTHRPLVAPVLPGTRYQGRPWYFVDIVARDYEANFETGRWAYNETVSFSGWVATRQGLRARQLDPDQLEWISTGSHAASLDAVRQGRADLAGIDSMITELAPELLTDLVVLDSWGPWPTPPVMVARTLDAGVVSDLKAALLGTDGEVLWVPIGPDHLDPIAAMRSSSTGM